MHHLREHFLHRLLHHLRNEVQRKDIKSFTVVTCVGGQILVRIEPTTGMRHSPGRLRRCNTDFAYVQTTVKDENKRNTVQIIISLRYAGADMGRIPKSSTILTTGGFQHSDRARYRSRGVPWFHWSLAKSTPLLMSALQIMARVQLERRDYYSVLSH